MAPLNANSGYREDYNGRQLDPNDRVRGARGPSNFQATKAAPGHFTTSNQAAHEAGLNAPKDRSHSYKPVTALPQVSRFAGNSSYQHDYPGHSPLAGAQPIRPTSAFQRTAALPGAFETTNQSANSAILQAHKDGTFQKTQSARGRDLGILGGAPLNANSTYREEYIKRPLEFGGARRPNDKGIWGQTGDSRDFLTTNGAVYRPPTRDESEKCPACHVRDRPASSDGHIKLAQVPDGFGHLTPMTDHMQSQPRYMRFAVQS